MLTDRLFGVGIPSQVKDKLSARQKLAGGDVNPGESLTSEFGDNKGEEINIKNNFNNQADLSSRTPWARMWTGIRLINDEGGKLHELARNVYVIGTNNLSEIDSYSGPGEDTDENGNITNATDIVQYEAFPPEHGIPGDNNKFLKPGAGITSVLMETEGAYGEIKKTTVSFTVHNFADFDQIYSKYFLRPASKIFIDFGWDSLETPLYDPMSIMTEDANSASNHFDKYLYGELLKEEGVEGFVTSNGGDAETVYGMVTDYTSKILANGSVECSLTIVSENQALASEKVTEVTKANSTDILNMFRKDIDEKLLFEQLYGFIGKNTKDGIDIAIANVTNGTLSKEDFEEQINKASKNAFGYDELPMPIFTSALSGVFIKGNDNFISWGLFEDEFLNKYFAHGANLERINDATSDSNKISFDSSKSFACLDGSSALSNSCPLLWAQQLLKIDLKQGLDFLIPEQWDLTYSTLKNKSGLTRKEREKTIESVDESNFNDLQTRGQKFLHPDLTDFNSTLNNKNERKRVKRFFEVKNGNKDACHITLHDWKKAQVPLREIFINTKVILKAFENGINNDEPVKKIVNRILEKMNSYYEGLWDWHITGKDNRTLSIQDLNYSDVTRAELQFSEQNIEDDFFQATKFREIFTFNIMGKNSIVTNYEVSLSMPTGDYGNHLAISAITSKDTTMYPPSINFVNLSALQSIMSELNPGKTNSKLTFENIPIMGVHNGKKKAQDEQKIIKANSEYQSILNILKSDNSTPNFYLDSVGEIEEAFNAIELIKQQEEIKAGTEEGQAAVIKKKNEIKEIEDGNIRVNEISDYWKKTIENGQKEDATNLKPIPLPITLTLTIYGVGIVSVGDIFRVDYLPQVYLERCYFQVIKVTQNLDSSGWYTTLETIFNLMPDKYADKNLHIAKGISSEKRKAAVNLSAPEKIIINQVGNNNSDKFNPAGLSGQQRIAYYDEHNKAYDNSIDNSLLSPTETVIENLSIGDPTYTSTETVTPVVIDTSAVQLINEALKPKVVFGPFTDEFLKSRIGEDAYAYRGDSKDNYAFVNYHYDNKDQIYISYADGAGVTLKEGFISNVKDKGWARTHNNNKWFTFKLARLTKVSIYNCKDLEDFYSHTSEWKPVTPDEDVTFENIEGVYECKISPMPDKSSTLIEEGNKWYGHMWVRNPMYMYTSGKKVYYYDGYGNSDKIGSNINNKAGGGGVFKWFGQDHFINSGIYAPGDEVYIFFNKLDTGCWAVIPKKGNSLKTIQSTYDKSDIGDTRKYLASMKSLYGPFAENKWTYVKNQ